MALESFPPLILVASRFLSSGAIMLVVAWKLGVHLPRGRELMLTALNGIIILGIGNACLTYSETWIGSGMAALFITTSPFWLVGIESALGGEKLHFPAVGGMLVGSIGAALLVAPGALSQGLGSNIVKGFLVLQVGCLCWSLGSILQRRQPAKAHPIVNGAVQQLAAGLAFLIPALLVPEHPIHWSFAWCTGCAVSDNFWVDRGLQRLCVCVGQTARSGRVDLYVHQSSGGRSARMVVLQRAVRTN